MDSITSAAGARVGVFHWQTVSRCRRVHQATAIARDLPSTFEEYADSSATTLRCVFSCSFTKILNRNRTNHGLIPVRGGRRAQGIQKVQELEQKVQALEQAIKTDVSTCQV